MNPKMELLIKKYVCPKLTQRKQNQNKVSEAKTVENIKYKPILSWSSDFMYRDLEQENENLKNGRKFLTVDKI